MLKSRHPVQQSEELWELFKEYRRDPTDEGRDEIVDDTNAALREHPEHHYLLFFAGRFVGEHGRYEDALAFYERGLETRPDNAHLFMGAAEAHFSLGNYDKAKDCITSSLKFDPSKVHALELGIHVNLAVNDIIEANRLADQLTALNQLFVPSHIAIVEAKIACGKYEEALKQLQKIRRKDNSVATMEARVYFHMGNPQKAVDILTPILLGGFDRPSAILFAACATELAMPEATMKLILGSQYEEVVQCVRPAHAEPPAKKGKGPAL